MFIFFLENTMVHTKVTPRKTKEVQLMASCMLCSKDFSNEEQLKTHLLQCVKEMTQFTYEVCSQVFKKKEYMKRHMKNIHGQVPNTGPKVVEVNKKNMKGLIRNCERWAGPNIICIGALYKIDLLLFVFVYIISNLTLVRHP